MAGGDALVAHGLVNRATQDVDLFSPEPGAPAAVIDGVCRALEGRGNRVEVIRRPQYSGGEFAQLIVSRDEQTMLLDLARDWRQLPQVTLEIGLVLHVDEAVGSKVTAMVVRGLPRNFIDVARLPGTAVKSCALAFVRDPGLRVIDFTAAQPRRCMEFPHKRLHRMVRTNPQSARCVRASLIGHATSVRTSPATALMTRHTPRAPRPARINNPDLGRLRVDSRPIQDSRDPRIGQPPQMHASHRPECRHPWQLLHQPGHILNATNPTDHAVTHLTACPAQWPTGIGAGTVSPTTGEQQWTRPPTVRSQDGGTSAPPRHARPWRDFAHVDTVLLARLYVFFVIEVGTRRVHLRPVIRQGRGVVTQCAGNFAADLGDRGDSFRFLVRDRDSTFTAAFDAVLAAPVIEVIQTPVPAPRANAYAERWVATIRRECPDRLLIVNAGHPRRVIEQYVEHYNTHRPHRSLGQRPPDHAGIPASSSTAQFDGFSDAPSSAA